MILVFQILLGIGIAGFLIIAFRKIPVLLNYPRHSFEEASLKQKLFERWQKIKEKITQSDFLHSNVIPSTDKFLRKSNIIALKLHNLLTKMSVHLRKKKQEKEENDENNEEMPS